MMRYTSPIETVEFLEVFTFTTRFIGKSNLLITFVDHDDDGKHQQPIYLLLICLTKKAATTTITQ